MLSDGGSPHPRCRGTPPGWWPPLFCTNLPVPTTGRVQSIQVVPRVSLVPRVQAVGVVMLSFDVGGFSLSRKQTLTIVRIVTNASAALQLEKQTLACVRVRSSYWTKPPRDPPARPGSPPPLDFFFFLFCVLRIIHSSRTGAFPTRPPPASSSRCSQPLGPRRRIMEPM